MCFKLTDEQIETVTGFADGADRIMQALGIGRPELNDALLDVNVERCPNPRCGWYTDSFLLLADDENEPDGFCDNCRKYDKPDGSSGAAS